jgi:1-acyl-sn-glycerol-3-phosphate acyltransferase
MNGKLNRMLRWLFFAIIVRALVMVVLGLSVRHRERLPRQGPAIIVANHNSHLDTLVLMSLLPLRLLPRIRPVAAMDYFLRNRFMRWLALEIIGIIPLKRGRPKKGEDPLADINAAIDRGEILILFPEGTRGEPERLATFRKGVARLAQRHPDVPIIPVFLHGLGKALPKGEFLLVPFFCDVFVGEPVPWPGNRNDFMQALQDAFAALAAQGDFPPWE